jgi:hypothetical protein
MNVETAKQNAAILYDNPHAIFKAGKSEKLETISKYNLIGRLVEWVKDKRSGGERKANTDKLISDTLDTIQSHIKECLYFPELRKESCFPPSIYLFNRSVEDLTKKLKNTQIYKGENCDKLEKMNMLFKSTVAELTPEQKEQLEARLLSPWNI